MEKSTVRAEDLTNALREIGVREGDVCLFHSSFKSLGHVEGGAQAVIDGFEAARGRNGPRVAPTLSKKDLGNS